MEFILFWITSIIASLGLELANELKIFKDIADAGYKFDLKRINELQKQISPNNKKNMYFSFIIPLINIFTVLKRTVQYSNMRQEILKQFDIIGLLEEMNELEKEEYLKKPTGLNAIIAPIKANSRLENAIKITNDDSNMAIYIEFMKEIDECKKIDEFYDINNIVILKSTDKLQKYTNEELRQIAYEYFNNAIKLYHEILPQNTEKIPSPTDLQIIIILNKINKITNELNETTNKAILNTTQQEIKNQYFYNQEHHQSQTKTTPKKLTRSRKKYTHKN